MKIYKHPAFIALGAATLCLLPLISPLVSPTHITMYHASGEASTVFIPVLLNLFTIWAFITALLIIAEKPGRRQVVAWSALILVLPWILLKSASKLMSFVLPYWLSACVVVSSLLVFIALIMFWQSSSPSFQHIRKFVTTMLAFVSLGGFFMLGQVFWFAWQARALNSPIPLHQRQTPAVLHTPHARIIWILLDELSYKQVYEQRFPGLRLPTFDAVAAQSTIFTHVIPAGIYTQDVIPSLFTGLPVDDIRAAANARQLSLHNPISGEWQTFDAHQTVFQDALNANYSTAVAGWYNPYCRILPQVLDRCFWISHLPYPGGIVPGWSIAKNTMQPLLRRIQSTSFFRSKNAASPGTALETREHIEDYRELLNQADAILSDPSATFVFLHMPIPHPGGIYDRQREVLTTGQSSYIDNLALADHYLAHVRSLLKQRGEWDSSTIVIMGDHSWRTKLIWESSLLWTPEDQAASHGGQFDDRPAYIVKMPQQQQAIRIDTPFAAIHTRSLLDAIIDNQITSSDGLNKWVQQQSQTPAAQ